MLKEQGDKMAKFRCKASGGIVEFTNEYDIEQVRKQEDYEEVIEEVPPPPVKTIKKTKAKED